MAQWQDEVEENLSGGAVQNPYVTRAGAVSAIGHAGYRGSTAILVGGQDVTNGAACASDSPTALTAAGARIHSFRANGVEMAYVDANGNFVGNNITVPSYGGMYVFDESAVALALTTGGTFYQASNLVAGTLKGTGYVTFANSALTIGANGAGIYYVSAIFAGLLNSADTLDAAIFVGSNVQNNIRIDQGVGGGGQLYTNGAIAGFLTLAAGDTVSLRFAADGNNRTFSVRHANVTLQRVE